MTSSNTPVQDLQNSATTQKVVVYTTCTCNKCAALKEWLKNTRKEFEERDLENVNVMAELVMRDIIVLSAPVIEIDGVVYTESQIFEGDSLAVDTLMTILREKTNG